MFRVFTQIFWCFVFYRWEKSTSYKLGKKRGRVNGKTPERYKKYDDDSCYPTTCSQISSQRSPTSPVRFIISTSAINNYIFLTIFLFLFYYLIPISQ